MVGHTLKKDLLLINASQLEKFGIFILDKYGNVGEGGCVSKKVEHC